MIQLLQPFVALPEATQISITFLVVGLVGIAFNYIGGLLPWSAPFLAKYKEEISLSLAAAVVGLVQNALPGAYPEISVLFVQLLLAALAATGLFKVFNKTRASG